MNTRSSSVTSIIIGITAGIVTPFLVVLILNLTGLMVYTGNSTELGYRLFYWLIKNLGWSLVFFSIVLMMFFYYLYQLKKQLKNSYSIECIDLADIDEKNQRLEKLISLFFGIGVLWTAIGMRSALTAALGDLDSQQAAALGAWDILSRLVDGGILLALSTTIVGGAGGYLMSLIKQWVLGRRLGELYIRQEKEGQKKLIDGLNKIIVEIKEKNTPAIFELNLGMDTKEKQL